MIKNWLNHERGNRVKFLCLSRPYHMGELPNQGGGELEILLDFKRVIQFFN